MNILVWNVRGLNHPLKQNEVASRIRKLNISLVCLLETRVKFHKMQGIVGKMFPGWSIFHNYEYARNGRIWMIWRDVVKVSLISTSDQSITSMIEYDTKKFILSGIYGCNEGVDRKKLWRHLESIYNEGYTEPWMLAGDYNVIATAEESCPFNANFGINADMRDFVEVRRYILVYDHAFTGTMFTWTNKHQDGFIARKLDRVLINEA